MMITAAELIYSLIRLVRDMYTIIKLQRLLVIIFISTRPRPLESFVWEALL